MFQKKLFHEILELYVYIIIILYVYLCECGHGYDIPNGPHQDRTVSVRMSEVAEVVEQNRRRHDLKF